MNTFIIESPYYYACSIVYSYFIQFNFFFVFFLFFARSLISDSTFRSDIHLLTAVLTIIAHVDAYYLFHHPHRTFDSIDTVSVEVNRPVSLQEDSIQDVDNEEDEDEDEDGVDVDDGTNSNVTTNLAMSRSDWSAVDTHNTFSAFEVGDSVMAWYDDEFYHAEIVEVDGSNEMFTLVFYDDNMEVDSYKAQWLKHVEN